MATASADTSGPLYKLTGLLARRTGLLVAAVAALTAALVVPFLTMAPDTSASTEPSGDVFTARDRIDDTFVSSVHPTLLIAEHESGDVLTADALGSLLSAEQALRDDPELGTTLFDYFDAESGTDVDGVVTLADLVDAELRAQGIDGVGAATDEQVRATGSAIIDQLGERSELLGISARSVREGDPTDGGWTVPALTVLVLSDNDALGFGNASVNLGGDTNIEEFDRNIQQVFRDVSPSWQVNGVAIDVNLTSQEQGAVAGPFIGFTILAVLVLVGLTFRSYWILATVSVAFLTLIIWLKGISNLIGLEDDLVLSLIVPVAMISFGVDFAFHAIGRYREERAEGRRAPTAVLTGLTAVSGALLLALISDATAFLANLTSGIESINQFGIGAAIALASAYLLLGVVTPLVIARIEAAVPAPATGRRSAALRVLAGFGAAAMTMTSVLMLVFVLPWLGVILTAATAVMVLVVPFLIQRRRALGSVGAERGMVGDLDLRSGSGEAGTENRLATTVGRGVAALALRPGLVLPVALAVTGLAAVFAVRVPAEFDVEDFFASDTDFVVGLDQLDAHVGDRGGETAHIYIEGDLTDQAALAAVASRVEEIQNLDTDNLSRDAEGLIAVEAGVLDVLDTTFESPIMVGLDQADHDRPGPGRDRCGGDRRRRRPHPRHPGAGRRGTRRGLPHRHPPRRDPAAGHPRRRQHRHLPRQHHRGGPGQYRHPSPGCRQPGPGVGGGRTGSPRTGGGRPVRRPRRHVRPGDR